jgi:hypothetical protein
MLPMPVEWVSGWSSADSPSGTLEPRSAKVCPGIQGTRLDAQVYRAPCAINSTKNVRPGWGMLATIELSAIGSE